MGRFSTQIFPQGSLQRPWGKKGSIFFLQISFSQWFFFGLASQYIQEMFGPKPPMPQETTGKIEGFQASILLSKISWGKSGLQPPFPVVAFIIINLSGWFGWPPPPNAFILTLQIPKGGVAKFLVAWGSPPNEFWEFWSPGHPGQRKP